MSNTVFDLVIVGFAGFLAGGVFMSAVLGWMFGHGAAHTDYSSWRDAANRPRRKVMPPAGGSGIVRPK